MQTRDCWRSVTQDLSGPDKVGLLGVGAPAPLDDDVGGIVARPHALVDRLAADQLGQEAAHERVPGACGTGVGFAPTHTQGRGSTGGGPYRWYRRASPWGWG